MSATWTDSRNVMLVVGVYVQTPHTVTMTAHNTAKRNSIHSPSIHLRTGTYTIADAGAAACQ